MTKSEILEILNNCEALAKKIKLEPCLSTNSSLDIVKCTDVLKPLSNENVKETSENCCTGQTSPPFLPRTRLRAVLQNKSNIAQTKVNTSKVTGGEKAAVKETKDPGNVSDLITKVPAVEKQFNVKKRIGWGTFSTVFLATSKQSDTEGPEQYYALKHICSFSTSTKRVIFETKCLKEIGGCDNVAGLKYVLRSGLEHVLVMPYYKQDRFLTIIQSLSFDEVREYMRNLLIALRRVHKFNVVHRDIKPSNFLYDIKNRSGTLVDFGLAHRAHYYKPSHKKHMSCPTPRVPTNPTASVAKPCMQRRKTDTLSGRASPLHIRSSSMVALAKSLHENNQVSRKRSADEDKMTPMKKQKEGEPGAKRPCLLKVRTETQQVKTMQNRFCGTPRPRIQSRHGFELRGVPIYIPLPSTPSPIGNSTGSDKIFTSASPVSCRSNITSSQPSRGKTIGDMLPNLRRHKLQNKTANITVHNENKIQATTNTNTKATCKTARNPLVAPRAGTSGFRAPEVLIQCPHQTTAVDIWSAGIMFLSLLTGRYPFFKPVNDSESLAQIITIFGTEKCKQLARTCGKKLTASYYSSGYKLQTVVEACRRSAPGGKQKSEFLKPVLTPRGGRTHSPTCQSNKPDTSDGSKMTPPPYDVETIPQSAYDLINGLLDVNPLTRLSAKEALEHPFFKTGTKQCQVSTMSDKVYVSEKKTNH